MISNKKTIPFLIIILIFQLSNQSLCEENNPIINIHYLGHSSFVLSFDNGINLVTDYGKENAWKNWGYFLHIEID